MAWANLLSSTFGLWMTMNCANILTPPPVIECLWLVERTHNLTLIPNCSIFYIPKSFTFLWVCEQNNPHKYLTMDWTNPSKCGSTVIPQTTITLCLGILLPPSSGQNICYILKTYINRCLQNTSSCVPHYMVSTFQKAPIFIFTALRTKNMLLTGWESAR
jgi:hypothetical protein